MIKDEKQTIIKPGSLMVFSKTRLLLLFLTSMLVGISFFFIGFTLGYNNGHTNTINNLKESIHNTRKMNNKTKQQLSFLDNNKQMINDNFTYNVHIGLFFNLEYALSAWKEISEYSKLSEKDAIEKKMINGQTFYQVTVGKFNTMIQAKTFMNMLSHRTNQSLVPILQKIHKIQK